MLAPACSAISAFKIAAVGMDKQAIDGWAYCLAVLADRKQVVVGGERGQLKLLSIPLDAQQ